MTLIGSVKYLRSRRAEALRELPPEQHHYLESFVRQSEWYPAADYKVLTNAVARLYGLPFEQALEEMGEWTAEFQTQVYGHEILGMNTASRIFAIWNSQWDSGELRRISEA